MEKRIPNIEEWKLNVNIYDTVNQLPNYPSCLILNWKESLFDVYIVYQLGKFD